jgi:hypothetical protein
MSDETKEQNGPQGADEAPAPIMIDMPNITLPKKESEQPVAPAWEVKNFTDLQSKEVIQFTRIPMRNTVMQGPLTFFRGRAFLQFQPQRPGMQQPPPQPVIFEFPTETSIEDCFEHFTARLDEHVEKMKKQMADQQRVVAARGMPQMPPMKRR